MMIDISTIHALELVQNLRDTKSRDCLYGFLNNTLTPMGARLLRSNILQPLTSPPTIESRWDALQELSTKEDVFFGVRNGKHQLTCSELNRIDVLSALKGFVDVDKLLTHLIALQPIPTIETLEHSINNVIMLRQFVSSVKPIYEAMTSVSSPLLVSIKEVFLALTRNKSEALT